MRKKHGLIYISAFMMLFLLAGCGGTEKESAANSINEETSGSSKDAVLQASVEGNVENPYTFTLSDFAGQEVTIEAVMRKECCEETEPAKEYTGIPLSVILNKAKPAADSTKLTVACTDGHQKNFVLEYVLQDDSLILSEQEGSLRVIAGDSEKYDASYWVSGVAKLTVN